MIDLREQNLASFFGLLSTVPDVESTARNPDDNIEPSTMPALVQLDGGHRMVEDEHGADMYVLDADVEIYVAAATIAEAAALLNLLWARLVKTVHDNRDLGGLAQDVRHTALSEPESDRSEDVGPFMVAVASFEIWFATAYGDPFNEP